MQTSSKLLTGLRRFVRSSTWLISIRLILSSLLLFSGFAKLESPRLFLDFVAGIGFDPPVDRIVLVCVIFSEVLLGAMCLTGVYLKSTLAAISGMLILFSVVIGIALAADLRATCGCFGATFSRELDGLSLVRNLALAGLAMHGSKHSSHCSLQMKLTHKSVRGIDA